jgi:Flp pilus assembly protein CpaB
MPYARSKPRGLSIRIVVALTCLLVPIAAMGGVGTLWALGQIDLPFLHRGEQIPPGAVAVIRSAGHIAAYTKLTRDHIWDAAKGRFSVFYMPKEQITSEMITDYHQIVGRVLRHEKPAGYVFTEKDFMPKGTRSGLVGGIPSGKRSLTLEATKINGIFGLNPGDHVDLFASIPVELPKGGSGRFGNALQAQAQIASMEKRARVRSLAQDAVLVTAVIKRDKPTTSRSLQNGTSVKMIPVQEVVIAVDPEEVAPITEAMATEVTIMCVARSGQPDDPTATSKTPGSDPMDDVLVVDMISGSKHDTTVLPESNRNGQPVSSTPARSQQRHRAAFRHQ